MHFPPMKQKITQLNTKLHENGEYFWVIMAIDNYVLVQCVPNSVHGCLNSLDWTTGLDYSTGLHLITNIFPWSMKILLCFSNVHFFHDGASSC